MNFLATILFWICAYFNKGFDGRWASYESLEVLKQTTNGSWTNKIRHYVIFCRVRLAKTVKVKYYSNVIVLNFAWILRERESLGYYSWCMKKPNIFTWSSFTDGYRGHFLSSKGRAFLRPRRRLGTSRGQFCQGSDVLRARLLTDFSPRAKKSSSWSACNWGLLVGYKAGSFQTLQIVSCKMHAGAATE